jgi:anionic cell wall polymer biosynthesis LytR-Cps2A-Psr (LCP) family protein
LEKSHKKKLLSLGAVFILLLAALVIIVHLIEKNLLASNTVPATEQAEEVVAEKPPLTLTLYGDTYTSSHEFETYLFIGTDDSGNEDGEGADYHGGMADFLNLLVIDHTALTYSVLALNRDTITEIPMMTQDGEVSESTILQLCAAHWYGGDRTMSCENTVDTVSALLGYLPIDGYFAISINTMPQVNHLVGGVAVTIEDDGLTAIDPAFVKGATVTLDDEQAAAFVQARMGVGEGLNTERMARQKQYLTAMMGQLKEKFATEPELAVSLFDELSPEATTDMNGNTISRMVNQTLRYTDRGNFDFEGDLELGDTFGDGVDHYEFYLDSENQMQVLTDLFLLEYQEF